MVGGGRKRGEAAWHGGKELGFVLGMPKSVAYQLCDLPQITHFSELYFSRVFKWGHYDHHHLTDLTALLGGLEKRTCMKRFGEAARQRAALLITP